MFISLLVNSHTRLYRFVVFGEFLNPLCRAEVNYELLRQLHTIQGHNVLHS